VTINNSTGLSGLYLHHRLPRVEEVVPVWFRLRNLTVFLVDQVDFVALGAAQNVFSACLPSGAIDSVIEQYEGGESRVTCEVSDDCSVPSVIDTLAAQVGSISTSVGVAGGGGVGCFCGSCIIALLFFRRKKEKSDLALTAAVTTNEAFNHFQVNNFFEESDAVNPLFEGG